MQVHLCGEQTQPWVTMHTLQIDGQAQGRASAPREIRYFAQIYSWYWDQHEGPEHETHRESEHTRMDECCLLTLVTIPSRCSCFKDSLSPVHDVHHMK